MRAVVFDLDGTLLNTLEDICTVVNSVLVSRGYPGKTLDEVRLAVGRGVDNLVRTVLPSNATDHAETAEDIRNSFPKLSTTRTEPYSGILSLLEELAGLSVPMAVLTNKPHPSALRAVERFFPDIPFAAVRGVLPEYPIKPNPKAAEPVLRGLGTEAADELMVGDSDVDMDTAVNAGMIPVGVSWGFRDPSLLVRHGAMHIVNEPSEIMKLILHS